MIEIAAIIAAALALDLGLGEPPRRIHPTVWMGRLTARLVIAVRARTPGRQRLAGAGIVAAVVAAAAAPPVALYAVADMLEEAARIALIVLSGAVLLGVAVSVRSMFEHVAKVMVQLEADNLGAAQERLATVVKRKTGGLGRAHILSGLVETIAENTVDGAVSPLSYFALAGLPGTLAYRAVNTIDAMIGYRTREFSNVGWFGAGCDRALNYIPARIGALLTVCAAALLGLDWRGAIRVMRRDHANTASPNAGYPISAMAGALGVRLEKVGHYVIGEGGADPTPQSVRQAGRVMLAGVIIYASAIASAALALGSLGVSVWWANV